MPPPQLPLLLAATLTLPLTAQSPLLLRDIWPGPSSSLPARYVDVFGTCFFTAGEAATGHALWKTDGTTLNTQMVFDFYPGPGGGVQPRELVHVDGLLFCFADDGVRGAELWASDGTTQGTYLVKDINPGNQGQPVYMDPPTNLTPWRGLLYFSARDGIHGRELMRSDGTATGTYLLKDICPGGNSSDSHPSYLTPVGDQLFFFAYEPSTGWELWKTDGTTAGTQLVKDVWPGPEPTLITHNSYPFATANLRDEILLFAAPDGTHGYELWRSDGTAAGTYLLKDIAPGAGDSWFTRNFTPFGPSMLFSAKDPVHGTELWITDGTSAGTVLLKDIQPGSASSDPGWMVALQDRVLFSANDGQRGHEPWITDGTSAGTQLLLDLRPGSASSVQYSQFHAIGSRYAYFAADDGRVGAELWRSDGTLAGTTLVQDLEPGSGGTFPELMTLSGGRLLFRARDSSHGQEPRVWFPGATAQELGRAWLPGPTPFGRALARLTAEDPQLGRSCTVRGRAHAAGLPIALVLGVPGAPLHWPNGCVSYVDPSGLIVPLPIPAPVQRDWSGVLAIPGDVTMTGLRFVLQTFQLNPFVTGQFDSSNAVVLTLGT